MFVILAIIKKNHVCLFVLLFGTFLIFLLLWQVEQACSALSSLAGDVSVAILLMKCDIMQPIQAVLKSFAQEEVISVLQVMAQLAFACDTVAQKMLTKDVLKSLKLLCAHKNPEASSSFLVVFYCMLIMQSSNIEFIFHQVQKLALLAVGNLAFCLENRRILVTSESLRDLLLRLTVVHEPRVNKAAARALAILGMFAEFFLGDILRSFNLIGSVLFILCVHRRK